MSYFNAIMAFLLALTGIYAIYTGVGILLEKDKDRRQSGIWVIATGILGLVYSMYLLI